MIIQASTVLSDVRDKVLGEKRIESSTFKWFGLRDNWYPEVMYESDKIEVDNVKQVRKFAEDIEQVNYKYNVFTANCKIYAQYVMKNSIEKQSWK